MGFTHQAKQLCLSMIANGAAIILHGLYFKIFPEKGDPSARSALLKDQGRSQESFIYTGSKMCFFTIRLNHVRITIYVRYTH